MKKCLIVLLLASLSIGSAFADQKNYGAGLGALVFEGQEGFVSQTLAVTFNQYAMNQFFAITTGTSGATRPTSIVDNDKVLKYFVAENMDRLATDIARGQGESLDTLVELSEVSAEKKSGYVASLQSNFGKIYSDENIKSADVLKNIKAVTSHI